MRTPCPERKIMKSICVYCGSANQASREYFEAAKGMGETLARRDLTLVYGGGRTGLMGALADSALANGGEVIGVITEGMNTPELAHTRLDPAGGDRHHPPAQGPHVRTGGRVHCPARRLRHAGRALRDAHLGADR